VKNQLLFSLNQKKTISDGKTSSTNNGPSQRKHYKLSHPQINMATRVSTGGTKSFHYKKGHDPKLKDDEKNKKSNKPTESITNAKQKKKETRQ